MAISDTQKVDYLWKKVGYAATKTDTSSIKEGFNEAIPSPLQIRGDKIMANAASIPGTIPGANTSVVAVFTTSAPVECTVDGTASTNRSWKTNLTDWISPEFGSTYQAKVYIHTSGFPSNAASAGTQVLAAGSNNNDEWFFDYQSGVLNFIGTNLPNGVSFTGKSVYISGARYISGFGIPAIDLGYISFSGNTISSTQTNGNIVLSPPGTGIVQFYGNSAVGLPVGTDVDRPSNPSVGYTRFNTDRDSIEYWGGSQWLAPGELLLSSQVITPDGSSNIYALTSNVNLASSLFVSINGTLQQSNSAYTIVNNNQIQFTETPVTSDVIEIRFLNSATATLTGLQNGGTQVLLDTANVNVTGNILPSANIIYSLGSETLQWKDLWVSGNTIHLGGYALTVTNGQLSIGSNAVVAADSYGNVNVAAYITSYTGNVGGRLSNTSQPFITSVGTLGSLSVTGNITAGNVSGTNLTGTITTASQPNITSLGTITSGTWTAGTVGVLYGGTGANTTAGVGGALDNLLPSGEQSGYVLKTSGAGSYYWASEYANLTYASNVGNIAVSGLTVQTAIETLENNKSPLASPVFTGVVTTTGNATIGGTLTVSGNLYVNGNVTYINANNINLNDSLIYLADDNPSDSLDIGIVSSFTSNIRYQHTGIVRDATDGVWKLFANVVTEPGTTVDFTNATYSNLQIGNLIANNVGGTLTTASQTNITSVGTLGSLSVTGNITAGNVSGTNLTGTIRTAAQPSITSVGTLSSLSVTGNITISSNVVFSGWSIRETGNKLYFAYNGVNKMSLDTGGNLVVTGDVTAFGTIT